MVVVLAPPMSSESIVSSSLKLPVTRESSISSSAAWESMIFSPSLSVTATRRSVSDDVSASIAEPPSSEAAGERQVLEGGGLLAAEQDLEHPVPVGRPVDDRRARPRRGS